MKVVIAHFKYFTDGFSINKDMLTRWLKHQKVSLQLTLLQMNKSPVSFTYKSTCFLHLQALEYLTRNHYLADLVG